MKTIVIAGNIGKDATTRTTQGGDKVTGWPVAVEERNGQEKRTIWFDCTLWGARGEKLAQYLTKGSKVSVAGELSTREHEGKTYLTLRADQVTLLGGGEQRGENRSGYSDTARASDQAQRPSGYGAGGRPGNDLEDSIPFLMEWR